MKLRVNDFKKLIREAVEEEISEFMSMSDYAIEKGLYESVDQDKYNLVAHIIDINNESGAHFSGEQLKVLMSKSVEELNAILDELEHESSLQENKKILNNLKAFIRETYEAACAECSYEEGVEETVEEDAYEMNEAKKKSKNWIAKAIKHPGALHKTAERKGLAKKGEPLSKTDLNKLEAMGGKTAKRARLARTLKGLKK